MSGEAVAALAVGLVFSLPAVWIWPWSAGQMVGFRYARTFTLTLPDSPSVPRFMRGNNLSGELGAFGIPGRVAGDYGMSAEELADLMNRWRDRFVGGESGRSR